MECKEDCSPIVSEIDAFEIPELAALDRHLYMSMPAFGYTY